MRRARDGDERRIVFDGDGEDDGKERRQGGASESSKQMLAAAVLGSGGPAGRNGVQEAHEPSTSDDVDQESAGYRTRRPCILLDAHLLPFYAVYMLQKSSSPITSLILPTLPIPNKLLNPICKATPHPDLPTTSSNPPLIPLPKLARLHQRPPNLQPLQRIFLPLLDLSGIESLQREPIRRLIQGTEVSSVVLDSD